MFKLVRKISMGAIIVAAGLMVLSWAGLSSYPATAFSKFRQSLKKEVPPEFEIEPDLKAFGDELLVRMALLNLFENACKFSPEGGHVSLTAARDGNFMRFALKDEGMSRKNGYRFSVRKCGKYRM